MFPKRPIMAAGVLLLFTLSAAAQPFCTAAGDIKTPTFEIEPSLIVRDPDVLDTTFQEIGDTSNSVGDPGERVFSFKRTIGALLTSAGMPNSEANRASLVRTLLAT